MDEDLATADGWMGHKFGGSTPLQHEGIRPLVKRPPQHRWSPQKRNTRKRLGPGFQALAERWSAARGALLSRSRSSYRHMYPKQKVLDLSKEIPVPRIDAER